jgi:hypothetical protein
MLEVTPLEFLLRGLPEAFLFIFSAYAFSKKFIDVKKYILSSVLFVIMMYANRFLPIHYGVHTILNLFVFIIITVNINKIDLIKSIRSGIITIVLLFITEGINVLIIQYIFKADIDYVFKQPALKVLYGIPSMLIFALIVIGYYIRLLKRKELKDI